MQLNVLLLPLLGGFLYLSIFFRTAYFLARQTATTFSFWLAVAGLALLILARAAVMTWKASTLGPSVIAVPALSLFLIPLLAALTFAFVISFIIQYAEIRRERKQNESIWWFFRQVVARSRKRTYKTSFLTLTFALSTYSLFAFLETLSQASPGISGASTKIIWVCEFLAYLIIAPWWARKIHAAPVDILYRGAFLGLGYLLAFEAVTLRPQIVKSCWLAFAKPTLGQFSSEELATSVLALLLGPIVAATCNVLYPRKAVQENLMDNRGANSLDRLFFRVTKRAKMVMLTLVDGKVYCGYIDWIPADPGAVDAYLEIQPVFSGYREKDSRKVLLPINYAPFYSELPRSEWVQFKKVIPISNITTAGEFDPERFDSFGKVRDDDSG